MFTLLTNRKMPPALAARIEASLRGGGAIAAGGGQKLAPRTASLLQFGVSGLVLALLCGVVFLRHRAQRDFEHDRAALLETVRRRAAPLTVKDFDYLARAEAFTVSLAARYGGDVIDGALTSPGALDAALHRPLVYVRLPFSAVSSRSLRASAVADSRKDFLLWCLLDPPGAPDDESLLSKVRMATSKAPTLEERTPLVHRLASATKGLPFLLPAWSSLVASTSGGDELEPLEREFEAAPLEEAKKSATADYFLAAIDETGEDDGEAESEPERGHAVRVGLFDAASSRLLLRVRRRVEPSGGVRGQRPELASCRLALEVREAAAPSKLR